MLAVTGCAAVGQTATPVRPGVEVLLADSLHLVRGRRVGLLTNQTGVDRAGVSDVERLLRAGVGLTALFSPEHGFRGVVDQDNIGNGVDSATGLPIYSLYGPTRAPTPEMLASLDVLLVDLQDIGARSYTYSSTTLLAMRAAAARRLPVIVLDRPDPIGGELVQGPVLDTATESSFIGMLPVPMRHGMTLGELAAWGNDVLRIGADLTVVPAAGWTRATWFDQTGLPWIRPSPSMPDLESAMHYPGTVLFEGTNLSVGRGTPVAFQIIGAPWLDVAGVLRGLAPPAGVALGDTVITPQDPQDGKFGGVPIRAVRLRVTDRAEYDPVATAVALLGAVRRVHPDSLRFRPEHFDHLAGGEALRHALERGTPAPQIIATWQQGVRDFVRARQPYLLYQ